MITKSKYTSTSVTNPFNITLDSGYAATPDSTRSTFMIEHTTNKAEWCLVDATIVTGVLTINRVIKSTTTNTTIPVFTGGATIFSMLDIEELSAGQGQGRDGILLLGQSNMSGHNGENEAVGMKGYDALIDTPDGRILQLRKSPSYTTNHSSFITDDSIKDTYVIATDPLDHANDGALTGGTNSGHGKSTSAGMGLTIAKSYVNGIGSGAGRQVVILPCAHGGTTLVRTQFTGAESRSWAAPGGSDYQHAVAVTNQFLNEHPDNRLVMICYQQGESDALAFASTPSADFQAALTNTMNTIREGSVLSPTLRQPTFNKVPIVIGEVTTIGSKSTLINAGIAATVAELSYCTLAPFNQSWPTEGNLSVHMNARDLRTWGSEFYDHYLEALDNHPEISGLPGPIQNLQAVESPTQITLTWDSLAGATGYRAAYKVSGANDSTYVLGTPGAGTIYQGTGFTSGVTYTLKVEAYNDIGYGAAVTIDVTPVADAVPGQVLNVTAIDGVSGITVSWDSVVADPAVTGYTIQRKITGAGTYNTNEGQTVGAVNSVVFTDVLEGTSYTFKVLAFNYGPGIYSDEVTRSHGSSGILALSPVVWFTDDPSTMTQFESSVYALQWLDQSGNGNHGDMPTASSSQSSSPTRLPGGGFSSNGRSGFYLPYDAGFDGSANGYTKILDVMQTATSSNDYLWSSYNGNRLMVRTDGSIVVRSGANSNVGGKSDLGIFPLNTRVRLAVTHALDGTVEYYKYESGAIASIGSATFTYDSDGGVVTLGARASSQTGHLSASYGIVGEHYNAIGYDKVLSSAELQVVFDEMTGAAAPADTVPAAVQNVAALQSGSQITIQWDALIHEPIVQTYTIQVSTTSGDYSSPVYTATVAFGNTQNSYTPPGDDTYYVNIFATNSIGVGVNSTEASVVFTEVAQEMIVRYDKGIGVNGNPVTSWSDGTTNPAKNNHGDASLDSENALILNNGGIKSEEFGNQALFLDDDLLFNSGSEAFTMLFDVDRITSSNSFNTLYGSLGNTSNHILKMTTSTGNLSFHKGGSTIVFTDNTFFPAGIRKRFALTMAIDGTVKIHGTDGAAVATGTGGQTTGGSLPALMGEPNSGSDFGNIVGNWDGTLYNFRAFNYVRSDAQIAALLATWGT